MKDSQDTLLKFPCQYPIKAMGKAGADFDVLVFEIVRKHTPDLADFAVQTRVSRSGRFISVTVVIEALSKDQLDNIYMDLTSNEHVLMAL